jgi:hypothetical protein
MPSASQNTDVINFSADGTELAFLALNNRLLSAVLTAVWILMCKGESKYYP